MANHRGVLYLNEQWARDNNKFEDMTATEKMDALLTPVLYLDDNGYPHYLEPPFNDEEIAELFDDIRKPLNHSIMPQWNDIKQEDE